MMNDGERKGPMETGDRFWSVTARIGDAMFWAPLGWIFFLFLFSARGEQRVVMWMPWAWVGFYVLLAPGVVWLASYADGMPVGRSVKALIVGAAPGVFFGPGGAVTQAPLIWAALPALIAWGVAGQYFSFHPLPRSYRWRIVALSASAAACLAGAPWTMVMVYAFRPSAADPAFLQQVALVVSAICIVSGLLFVWLGVRLLHLLRRTLSS